MLIFLGITMLARVFTPHDAVLVNQKLKGYWIVTVDSRPAVLDVDSIQVVKFKKCKSVTRKQHLCEYDWAILHNNSVINYKLNKEAKKNWIPKVTKPYWVEKKKNKETKREMIHIEEFNEISINLVKKEVEFYLGDSLVITIKKLK